MNWLGYAILGVILMGVAPVFAKSGMRKCSSDLGAAIFGTVLFLAVGCTISFMGIPLNLTTIGQTAFMYLIFLGFAIGAQWLCLFRALRRGMIHVIIPIVEASLILDILAGIFIFHDGWSVNNIIILLLLTTGVILMSMNRNTKKTKSAKKGKKIWMTYTLGAMFFVSLASLLERIGAEGISTYPKRLICYGVAVIVIWVLTFATGSQRGVHSMSFLDGIYLSLAGACVGGAQYCFYKAASISEGFNIEVIEVFDLAAAVIFAYACMKERVSTRAIFGMVLMLAGFLLWNMKLPVISL